MTDHHPMMLSRVTYGSSTLLMLCVSLSACADSDQPTVETYLNDGRMCLLSNERGEATINITFDPCLSCNQVPTASCSATLTGDEIAVSTILEVETRDTPRQCPDNCTFASATCSLIVAPPGDYLILHDDKSATVTLPVTTPVAPYGDGGCGS